MDSLDTMLIMGLHNQYKRAVNYLKKNLNWDQVKEKKSSQFNELFCREKKMRSVFLN